MSPNLNLDMIIFTRVFKYASHIIHYVRFLLYGEILTTNTHRHVNIYMVGILAAQDLNTHININTHDNSVIDPFIETLNVLF